MSSRFIPALCALLLFLLPGCAQTQAEPTIRNFFAMDTVMSIQVYGPESETAADAAVSEVNQLEKLFSRTLDKSDIAQLNACAGDGTAVSLSPETVALLSKAQENSSATAGAFDPTIAPVMDAWGFGTSKDTFRVPSSTELSSLLPLVNYTALKLNAQTNTAQLESPGMEVDLGGIAKGYAADRLVSLLNDSGITSALLNLGSSTVTALGNRPDGTPWRIALRDPQQEDQQLLILELSDQALSTSGGYERFFEENGVTYHHILDPETGYPAQSGLLSVTIVAKNGAMADAWSTALYVLGPERALELWRARDDFECVLCCSDGTVLVTEGLEDALTFKGENNGYTYEIVRR